MISVRAALAAILAWVGIGATARAETLPTVEIGSEQFFVRTTDTVQTAGGRLLGLLASEPSRKISVPEITLDGLPAGDANICVVLQSVSGTYSARFTVPNPRLGPSVRFVLPGQKFSGVGLRAAEMAVLARVSAKGPCQPADPLLPARFGAGPGDAVLIALVNDHQAEETAVVTPKPVTPCASLRSELGPRTALTAYNVACPITLPKTCQAQTPISIQLDDGVSRAYLSAIVRRGC